MFMVWGHFTFSVNLRRRDNLYSISDDQILRFILRLLRGCQTWEWESREGRDEGSLLVFLVWCVSVREHRKRATKSLNQGTAKDVHFVVRFTWMIGEA